jgi:osmotically-inducible protein OsmY
MWLGALAIAITGSAGAARANDDQVENRIETRFHQDTRLKADHLRVDVDDGVAVIEGKVATQAERAHAEHLARVSGVTRVENKIEIDTGLAKERVEDKARAERKAVDERAEREKDHIDAQEARSKQLIDAQAKAEHGTASERTTATKHDTVGDEVSDTWITTKVKSQFFGVDALKGSDISVDTDHNGVVTLTGNVPSEAARARAVEIAKETKGVRRVVDAMKMTTR